MVRTTRQARQRTIEQYTAIPAQSILSSGQTCNLLGLFEKYCCCGETRVAATGGLQSLRLMYIVVPEMFAPVVRESTTED